jgi:hypothetical protein
MTAESVKKNQISKPRKPTELQQKIIETHQTHPTLNKSEIATVCKTDHAHVIRTLQAYGLIKNDVDNYIKNRAVILAGMQHRLLSSITQEDIQKTPVGSRILAAAQLFDKEKAELGQSTDKQPVLVLVRGDNCKVSIGGKVEDDASASDKMSKLVDITPDDKSLHKLSD